MENKRYIFIISILIIICITFCIGFFIGQARSKKRDLTNNIYENTFYTNILDDETKNEDVNKKEFAKTYTILNIAESNDEKYLYLTIRQFQFDEVETVKVLKSLADTVEINKNYEFTFESSNMQNEDSIKSIFNNAILISVKETDKTGLE